MSKGVEVIDWLVAGDGSPCKGGFLMNVKNMGYLQVERVGSQHRKKD